MCFISEIFDVGCDDGVVMDVCEWFVFIEIVEIFVNGLGWDFEFVCEFFDYDLVGGVCDVEDFGLVMG